VYATHVKRRELETSLRELGWAFLRHGGNHDVWSDGDRLEYVPRHAEINENLARKILRKAAMKRESES
jgi:mRNA interferase HicA